MLFVLVKLGREMFKQKDRGSPVMQSGTCRGAPSKRQELLLLVAVWEALDHLWLCQGQEEMLIPSLCCLSWGIWGGCNPLQSWGGENKPSTASSSTCCFTGSFYNIGLWKQPLFAGIITRIFLHLSKLKYCLGNKLTLYLANDLS